MSRERIAWTLCMIGVVVLATSLPGSFAARDSDYEFVRRLVDIQRQVGANYVDVVDDNALRQAAIDGMLAELDPFTEYVPPERQEAFDRMLDGSFKGVGIQLDLTEEGDVVVLSPIEGTPAFRAGVMAGDVIEKVNGEDVKGVKLPELIKKIGGPLGSQVTLTLRRGEDATVELTMKREEIVVPTTKGYFRNADNTWNYFVSQDPPIAYVRVTQFTPDTGEAVEDIVRPLVEQGMKGLILDLRFNPGGRLEEAVKLVDLFVDQGTILSTRGRSRPEQIETAQSVGTLEGFPLVVLVNEHSASAAEIVAGSLKDNHRAVVVGMRSYGKGSVQEVVPLDANAGELKLTTAYYYLPSGRLVHRKKDATDWGVEPDVHIAMDDKTMRTILEAQFDADLFHKPGVTTSPAVAAASRPVDRQLAVAVESVIALIEGRPVPVGEQVVHNAAANGVEAPASGVEPDDGMDLVDEATDADDATAPRSDTPAPLTPEPAAVP